MRLSQPRLESSTRSRREEDISTFTVFPTRVSRLTWALQADRNEPQFAAHHRLSQTRAPSRNGFPYISNAAAVANSGWDLQKFGPAPGDCDRSRLCWHKLGSKDIRCCLCTPNFRKLYRLKSRPRGRRGRTPAESQMRLRTGKTKSSPSAGASATAHVSAARSMPNLQRAENLTNSLASSTSACLEKAFLASWASRLS